VPSLRRSQAVLGELAQVARVEPAVLGQHVGRVASRRRGNPPSRLAREESPVRCRCARRSPAAQAHVRCARPVLGRCRDTRGLRSGPASSTGMPVDRYRPRRRAREGGTGGETHRRRPPKTSLAMSPLAAATHEQGRERGDAEEDLGSVAFQFASSRSRSLPRESSSTAEAVVKLMSARQSAEAVCTAGSSCTRRGR